MNRRTFLSASTFASVGLIAGIPPGAAGYAEVEITPSNAGTQISPHLYGQFLEHLGGVIYDGVWVGPKSKIANVEGIRKQFLDDMKRIGVPDFRWPGGCFADGYHGATGSGIQRSGRGPTTIGRHRRLRAST
jgi:alpha-N-arabinofuranosidase